MALLLRGRPAAEEILSALPQRIQRCREYGQVPALCMIRVGNRAADLSYEKGAGKLFSGLGLGLTRLSFPETVSAEELCEAVLRAGQEKCVHGILLLRPFGRRDLEQEVSACLAPPKDVDGQGRESTFSPCAAEAALRLLDHYGIETAGVRAAVIGRSSTVSLPLGEMLRERGALVSTLHRGTSDLAGECRKAELLVSAAGCPGLLSGDFFHGRQVVLDIGISAGADGRLCGDADFQAACKTARAVTPVPGGVGAVTAAVLAEHVVRACESMMPGFGA